MKNLVICLVSAFLLFMLNIKGQSLDLFELERTLKQCRQHFDIRHYFIIATYGSNATVENVLSDKGMAMFGYSLTDLGIEDVSDLRRIYGDFAETKKLPIPPEKTGNPDATACALFAETHLLGTFLIATNTILGDLKSM